MYMLLAITHNPISMDQRDFLHTFRILSIKKSHKPVSLSIVLIYEEETKKEVIRTVSARNRTWNLLCVRQKS